MLTEIHPDPERTLSHAHMREIVNHALAQGFTGLGIVSFLLGQEIKLLIQDGSIRDILLKDNRQKRHFPGEKYQDADFFEALRMGHLRLLKVPGRFLLFERACFDTKEQETLRGVNNAELKSLFFELEKQESATVVALRWNDTRAYVMVPGSTLSLRRAVFINGSDVVLDDSALSLMAYWQDPRYDVTTYKGGLQTETWIALHLNVLFEHFCESLLNQYGYLTGKVMVNSMVRNLAHTAHKNHCDLSATSTQVQDQTLFASLSDTVVAYKTLLDFLDTQMESVVGSNFFKSAKRQSLDPLNPFYINLARFYGFNF